MEWGREAGASRSEVRVLNWSLGWMEGKEVGVGGLYTPPPEVCAGGLYNPPSGVCVRAPRGRVTAEAAYGENRPPALEGD